jgi:hypothetical protein
MDTATTHPLIVDQVVLTRVDQLLAAARSHEQVRYAVALGSGMAGGLFLAGAIDANHSVALQQEIAAKGNTRLGVMVSGSRLAA